MLGDKPPIMILQELDDSGHAAVLGIILIVQQAPNGHAAPAHATHEATGITLSPWFAK